MSNVRLIDIANTLGLTVNTVSRALRDMPDIGEDTKIKVRELADKMGYIPNSIASSLRSGNSHIIAVVFDNMTNPYFMIMADKLHKRLEALGYATMIFGIHDIEFKIKSLYPIIARKVDAIITFLEPDIKVVKACKQNKIPILLFGRENSYLNIDSVTTNDFLGGYEVGKLLVSKGAKNIGYIGAPKKIECSVRRLNGLKRSLDDLKVDYDELNFRFMNSYNIEDDLLFLLKQNVDSIFCFNDVMALEVITLLEERNYKIPEDIKVVGYDNIQNEFLVPNRLSTVDSDKEIIIDTVVDMIMTQLKEKKHRHHPRQERFDVWIKEGKTT